ncbi:MAG: ferrous iron transporter B [Aequoribacter sp.]|uniref:ferrous iron transporter B n=1 Tax=Aequoribacter sp. TaxID=2847771 RepID=UPI003C4B5C01
MKDVLVIGSPNSGKTLLFNRLTGLKQKVANFPGVTVSTHAGTASFDPTLQLVDFPGVYSLHTISGEEEVAVRAFQQAIQKIDKTKAVLCVLDATRLEKGLFFALQVREACVAADLPFVVACNMVDILDKHKLRLDLDGLERELGVPLVGVSAKSGFGLERLQQVLSSDNLTTPPADSNLLARDEGWERNRAEQLAHTYGPKGDLLLKSHSRLDDFFLHSVSGGLAFFVIMFSLFQAIFTWAAPMMDAVEASLGWAAEGIVPHIGNQLLADFVRDAIFGGVGAFLVFVPQIFVLTLVVGTLEDSGYLARAAVICHRPLNAFGLTGKSFVPMLSGVACAIPAIYAARTIESPRKRWLTYMAIPLMPCSARLPVYALLIAAFIPNESIAGGLLGLQGLAMFGIYLFGIVTALLVTAAISRVTPDEEQDASFVLEMPPYRLPSWQSILRGAIERAGYFVKKAGPVIFWITMLIWFLGYFPNQGQDLSQSYLAWAGRLIEPVFQPLGLDWKYGIAILASFVAREVFVGTLGTLYGIEDATENVVSLATRVQESGLPLASGVALLVFFAVAAQCVSTLATLYREGGSAKLPLQLLVGYGLLSYALAWCAFTLLS